MTRLAIAIGRGASRVPAEIALSLIPSLPRPVLERLAQQIIDHLDEEDGEADVEPNGDEQDHSGAEDDYDPARYVGMDLGPGCPVADIDEGDNRTRLSPTLDGEDQSFVIMPAPKGIEPTRWQIS